MNYEQKHIAGVSRWFLIAYWAHLPVFAAMAWFQNTSLVEALVIGVLAVAGPAGLHFMSPGSRLTAVSMGVGAMALSAGLIHLGGGKIEMHFHVFVLIPMLAVFGQPMVVLAAAAVIAVHHVAFFFFLPKSLFHYEASLWVVVLHAVFVILAAVPGCVMARMFGRYVVGARKVMGELGGAGAALARSSDELLASSASSAERASAQAAAVEEISATLHEFSSQTR